jgi:hypothetical protein
MRTAALRQAHDYLNLFSGAIETSWIKIRLKPCRVGPFGLYGEFESSQN